MKKKISALLIMVGIVSLVGCGSTDNSSKQSSSNPKVESISEKDTVKEEEVIQEVLLDNEAVKITFVGVDNKSFFGPSINLEIENKLDRTIMIQSREVSVNGVMTDPIFSCEVAAGKKAKDSISFDSNDIKELVNVEGLFHIFYSDDWSEIGDYSFAVLQKETSEEIIRNEDSIILVDNEFVTISYLGKGDDSIFGPELIVEIVNKTENTITVQTREVSVDGYMIDPIFSCEIAAGKKAKDGITFMDDDVSELKNIEGKFHIYSSDSWSEIGDYSFNIE